MTVPELPGESSFNGRATQEKGEILKASVWEVYRIGEVEGDAFIKRVHPKLVEKAELVFGYDPERLWQEMIEISPAQLLVVGWNNEREVISFLVGRYMEYEGGRKLGISAEGAPPTRYFDANSLLILRVSASIAEEGSVVSGINTLLNYLEQMGKSPEYIVAETYRSYNDGKNVSSYRYLLERMKKRGIISDYWLEEGANKVSFVFPCTPDFRVYVGTGSLFKS